MYLISQIKCVSGDMSNMHSVEIETENIEITRSELHRLYQCDRILFIYEQLK